MTTVRGFIEILENTVDVNTEFTFSQVAQIIAKAMINFFDESGTSY